MRLAQLLTADRVAVKVDGNSKKAVLERLAQLIASANPTVTTTKVFDSLIARERLGSTGLGHGVAIPHGRSPTQRQAVVACVVTKTPIEFDAIDNQPVDIFFGLSVPEEAAEEHLAILAEIMRLLADEKVRAALRRAEDSMAVYRLLTEPVDTAA